MTETPLFKRPEHDHHRCVDDAITAAVSHCRRAGARLTEQRRRVLEIVWSSHAPIGAYAILEQLAEEGTKPAPMTVYRALDFLQEQNLVHRVAGLNAFVGCTTPDAPHDAQFLICRSCGEVAELHDSRLNAEIARCVAAASFQLVQGRVELEGICANCHGRD
jgi:Fur family zinc uptake transcriptional regulator